jgi:ATP-dependent RNA helicase RhlE
MSESAQLQAIRKGAQVLIATPGRLCDYLKRNLVNLSAVRVLVLDEADRMLDMGFMPSIQLIVKAMPSARQTLCFSATSEASVARVIEKHVKNPVRYRSAPPPSRRSMWTCAFTKSNRIASSACSS